MLEMIVVLIGRLGRVSGEEGGSGGEMLMGR